MEMYSLAVKFIMFVIDGPGNFAQPDEMKQIDMFNESLQAKGLWIIEAESRQVAEELAAQGSRACNRRVELRPFH